MKQNPVMIFHIVCDWNAISQMDLANGGHVTMIPFSGSVESELFTGTIQPGAVDVQVTNAAGVRHMCAKYMFVGKDAKGNDCHLYVENNGYFEKGNDSDPFHATPTFKTDSRELEGYLMREHFRSEGHGTPVGPDIHIIDTDLERM